MDLQAAVMKVTEAKHTERKSEEVGGGEALRTGAFVLTLSVRFHRCNEVIKEQIQEKLSSKIN